MVGDAAQGLVDLLLAAADRAGNAHDLASAYAERDRLKMLSRQPFDLENDTVGGVTLIVSLELGGAAVIDHQLGDPLLGDLVTRQHGGDAAAAQDRDPVANRLHLAQPVRNVDDGDTLLAEALHDPEQQFDLGRGETRRRFIEYDHLVAALEQGRERHELHLGGAQA